MDARPEAPVNSGGRWFAAGSATVGALLLIHRTVPAIDLRDIATRWWPIAVMALGVIGVIRLMPAANAMFGPILLVTAGGLALIFTLQPFPAWARPLLLPVVLIAAGIGLLLPGPVTPPQTIGDGVVRQEFILLGRSLEWNPAEHPMLELRAVIGGCALTVLPPPARDDEEPAPRLEIRALLSGIDITIPAGLRVHVNIQGPVLRRDIAATQSSPATADLTIVVLSGFASPRVKVAV